jgi:hypothetical protein
VIYSVFRSHVTVGTVCDELDCELLTNNDDPVVESSRYWSLGSSFGRFFGSGFSARKEKRENAFRSLLTRKARATAWIERGATRT